MIIFLSPSTTLDFETPLQTKQFSESIFLQESKKLAAEMKNLSSQEIAKMMKVSEKIANLNFQRFQAWKAPFNLKNARQAILAFKGDVYRDIETNDYSPEDFNFAQKHLRIISGLYGMLKPLDLMQPYRLEMKYRKNHWKPILSKHLIEKLSQDLQPIINLASKEYSEALDLKNITKETGVEVISPEFRTKKGPDYKIIPIYAKIARGTMANWIIRNRITNPAKLKDFTEDGWKYAKDMSKKATPTFVR